MGKIMFEVNPLRMDTTKKNSTGFQWRLHGIFPVPWKIHGNTTHGNVHGKVPWSGPAEFSVAFPRNNLVGPFPRKAFRGKSTEISRWLFHRKKKTRKIYIFGVYMKIALYALPYAVTLGEIC